MVTFSTFYNNTILYLCEMKTTLCRFFVFLFVLMIFSIPDFAQDGILKGRVADHQSEEVLPYVSVSFVKAKRGVLTDSAGFFNIPFSFYGKEDSLLIQSVGYNPLYIPLTKLTSNDLGIVHLFVQAAKQEAVVKSKYNRALWFWRKIMSKKYKSGLLPQLSHALTGLWPN